jgi:hypothetical protein
MNGDAAMCDAAGFANGGLFKDANVEFYSDEARKAYEELHGRETGRNITYNAPVACPSCGHESRGTWARQHEEQDQHCPACGHDFPATWPGFRFLPRIVIEQRDGGTVRGPG